ncbi:MAG: alpha-galactosidase [Sphaerochaetaceae bacterium]
MIHEKNLVFTLHTAATTYLFRVNETNHLEHLYYGRKIQSTTAVESLFAKHTIPTTFATAYSEEYPALSLDALSLEYSTYGKGDYREPSILFSYNQGDRISDFTFKEYRLLKGKPRSFSGLPESYGDKEECSTLIVVLQEKTLPIRIELSYTTFDSCNVIVRKSAIINETGKDIELLRLGSLQLDLPDADYNLITFDGSWGKERQRTTGKLRPGVHLNDSKTGLSSSAHNPLVFLSRLGSTESNGDCYGCNLVYSGDHCQAVEVSALGKTRLITGLNPATFSWTLHSQEKFHTPEAILTYSHLGIGQASRNFHRFVNAHIIRGMWKNRQRPILVNSWESMRFDISEQALLKLGQEAADIGIELLVVDDGWFGSRDDDTSSLGDWIVNTKKIPSGLGALAKKIHQMGLLFGLWCEPEMVSRKSQLYRDHPQWLIRQPGRTPSAGRNQYLLDLSRDDVRDHLFETLSTIWRLADVDYVKWDMNRNFSDMHSQGASFNQKEFNHRYMLGLYELMERFVKAFPQILFEFSSGGGNRFDLGMLCYMPQGRVSDSSDPHSLIHIQEGTGCGYPLSSIATHVTKAPHHQTLRQSNVESCFNVAAFGVLGYELDLQAISNSQKEIIKEQITFYKQHRSLFQYGELFRLQSSALKDNRTLWALCNADKSEMLILYYQDLSQANPPEEILRVEIADPKRTYALSPRTERLDLSMFGSLINAISPLQLKQDGTLQKIVSEAVKLPSELEYHVVPGDILAYHGVHLNQQFGGSGYDKETRVLGDFGSRIYHLKAL